MLAVMLQQERPIVARIAVGKATTFEIQYRVKSSYELMRLQNFMQKAVDPIKSSPDRIVVPYFSAEEGPETGHYQRRGNAFSNNIGDSNSDLVGSYTNEIVIVTAYTL